MSKNYNSQKSYRAGLFRFSKLVVLTFSIFISAALNARADYWTLHLDLIGSPSSSAYSVQAVSNVTGDIRVEFAVDGAAYHTENFFPYVIFGDNGTVSGATLSNLGGGTHTVHATLFYQGSTTAIATYDLVVSEPADASATPSATPSSSPPPTYSSGTAAFTMSSGKLTSIKYNGAEYFYKVPWDNSAVQMKRADGSSYWANMDYNSYSDATSETRVFSWGKIKYTYATDTNKFYLTGTITNSTADTIKQYWLLPMELRFPSTPSEYDPTGATFKVPMNSGELPVQPMTHSAGRAVLVNENLAKPLGTGFPWSINYLGISPDPHNIWPLWITTGRYWAYPPTAPYIDRTVGPGASDTFRISIRFAPTGIATSDMTADVPFSVAKAKPFVIGSWTDRRSIGSMFLARIVNCGEVPGFTTNPRGWFNDPTVNVQTADGIAAFQKRLLSFADAAVARMKAINSQGMVTWDIEGEWFYQPISYIGDPRLAETLAPELVGVVDTFFKKFRDAGLKVGCGIRPQELRTTSNWGNPGTYQWGDALWPDASMTPDKITAVMIDKIKYAKNRWGCTMFYVDSNDFRYDAEVFERILAAVPGILLMPEHYVTEHYAYCAPLSQLWYDHRTDVDAATLAVYPNAFTVIRVADAIDSTNTPALVDSIKRGNILMYRGWMDDPINTDKVRAIYDAAGQP